jgi:Glycosyltransferase family 92
MVSRRSLSTRSLSSDELSRRVPLLRGASSDQLSSCVDLASLDGGRSEHARQPRLSDRRAFARSASSEQLLHRAVPLSVRKQPERIGSDTSLDTSSLPRRGRKRLERNGVPSTSSTSVRSLNSSSHGSSSDFSYGESSFYEKRKGTTAPATCIPIARRGKLVTTIGMLALFCVASLFVQNFVFVSNPLKKQLASRKSKAKRSRRPVKSSSLKHGKLDQTAKDPTDPPETSQSRFELNRKALEDYQSEHGTDSVRKIITAYTEPPLQDTVPGTGSRDNPADPSFGAVPTFKIPLPRRPHRPDHLQMHVYPAAQSCHDLPAKFPVDRGLQLDPQTGEPIVWNVGHEATPPDFPQTQAPYCPVELDPFLPWIHDVVPSIDGTKIQFVAQNMRRCRTGPAHTDNVNRLVPQVTLLQAVSVQRINESVARALAPDLWTNNAGADSTESSPRYRLAPMDEASTDGRETRFVCRFHSVRVVDGKLQTVHLGETLSVFPFNYEFLSYRKSMRALLTPRGNDAGFFWSSSLQFECPVPKNDELRRAIASGRTTLSDGTPVVHVDIAPIRTSVRYDEVYLTTDQIGPKPGLPLFDPIQRWGNDNVLPRFEASGRWANIPICRPPNPSNATVVPKREESNRRVRGEVKQVRSQSSEAGKPHFLSACLWASAEFKQRGESKLKNTDTVARIQEWIEFHLLVGFDHIYVYDNTGAHTNETSFEKILSQYPASQVTRIDWPSTVCNNNRPNDESAGERSSQYAAETSCRV